MLSRKIAFLITVIIICFPMIYSVQASSSNLDPFPIGICWGPSTSDTTLAKYQEIKDMNATFALLGPMNQEFSTCDAALQKCAAVGLKGIISDERMLSYLYYIDQPSSGNRKYVSSSNSLGQTFTTTTNTYNFFCFVKLNIDYATWSAGTTLTLSLYDSPSKINLLGRSSKTSPDSEGGFPVFLFSLGTSLAANTSYYIELTSNSTANVQVNCSTTDAYNGGTAYDAGIQGAYDFWFKIKLGEKMYLDGSSPSTTDIDEIANHYKNNPALFGYEVFDEPSLPLMTRMQSTIERFRQDDPDHITFTNLFPNYANSAQLGISNSDISGSYVTPTKSLGQTFMTNAVTTCISTIQLFIDNTQWSSNENLTLKLWDSAAKTLLLGQYTLNSSMIIPSTQYPLFTLNATVSPNTIYYWELTHDGGADNSVGLVVRSANGVDWERDGTAYEAGTPINSDFWFTINQKIDGLNYEYYVYNWANKRPDVVVYDHYPFKEPSGISSNYFDNIEIIRRQTLQASVDFWAYIQSVGISNSLRVPSEGEIRYQVYTNLAYGAKGIVYFTYVVPHFGESFHDALVLPDGTKNITYTYAKNINGEVLKLGTTLKTLTSQEVYHTGATIPDSTKVLPEDFFWKPVDLSQPLVIGYFKNIEGKRYVMVVNRDPVSSRNVTFQLSSKPGNVTEVSKTTGLKVSTNYNYSSGTLSAAFAPGEGRLYAISNDIHVGMDTVGSGTDVPSSNAFAATKATANQNETVNLLNLYIDSNAVGTARMGIYSDNNGSPGTLLAQTGDITLANGWNTGVIPSTSLVSGTDYWLVFSFSQEGSVVRYNSKGTLKFVQNYSYGALPSTAPAMTNTNATTYSFYASGTSNLGMDTVGSGTDVPSSNAFAATKVTVNQNETVNLLNLYIDSNAVGTVRMGIYSDNNGSPGTLLAQTGDITLVNGWNTGVIPSTSLVSGTDYWLVFSFSQEGSVVRYNATGTLKFVQNYSYRELPSTAPAMTNTNATTYSFYASGTSNLGMDTVGSGTDVPSSNAFAATKATANQNETVNLLNLYTDSNAVGTARMGIYSDNNGSPGTLLAQTGDITLVNGWNTGVIPSTSLVSGTDYWLVFCFSQEGSVVRYNATGTLKFVQNYSYGELPSTAPAMTNTNATTYSFYASP